MAKTKSQLQWCIVKLGEDINWWVKEISDDIHWDLDALSIIDPKQIGYIIDLLEPLNDYGLDPNILEAAFFAFRIDKDLGNSRLHLTRVNDSLLDTEEQLFALPNVVDEETGAYADFINHITKLRIKFLNDTIDFEEKLTQDEIEEQLREEHNNRFIEGQATHLFDEIVNILEYVPAGFEAEDDEEEKSETIEKTMDEEFPDIEEEDEDSDHLNGDETLRWEEDEEEGENLDDLEDDDEEGEAEEEELQSRSRKRGKTG